MLRFDASYRSPDEKQELSGFILGKSGSVKRTSALSIAFATPNVETLSERSKQGLT